MFTTAFLDLPPLEEAAGTVSLPGSKSISNRVLLLAALSAGTTVVHDLLDDEHGQYVRRVHIPKEFVGKKYEELLKLMAPAKPS